jgi:precorrin-6B methylase 2
MKLSVDPKVVAIKSILGDIKLQNRLLDVGCGTGDLTKLIVIRHSTGLYFLVRPNTMDLYDIALAELYELKKWFLPRIGGVVVDVGAYIGKYAIFACAKQNVRRVIAIEPVPANAVVIRANAKLNECEDKVSVVEEAVASARGELTLYIPYDLRFLSLGGSTLKPEDGGICQYM